jgi:ActR/RegA family two-component response regulator
MEKIKPLWQVRKEHIMRVLSKTKGDLEKAGRILGISPGHLRRIMNEQRIPWPSKQDNHEKFHKKTP